MMTVVVSTIAVKVSTICAVLVSTMIVTVDPSLADGDGVGTIAIFGMEPRRTSTLANLEYRCKVSLSDRMPNLNKRPSSAPASAMTANGKVMEVVVEATALPPSHCSQLQKIA